MSYLAVELTNYYKKSGNRILFGGRFSLNELALAMWERLHYSQIDASVVSRVIKGKRLFTPTQIRVFSKILQLDEIQVGRLRQALMRDLLTRSRFIDQAVFLQDIPANFVEIIEAMIVSGRPDFAIQLINLFADTLSPFLKSQAGEIIYAKLLNQKARAYGLILPPNSVLDFMQPLNNLSLQIGLKTKNREILDMAYMNIGGGFYVGAKWRSSAQFLESKLDQVNNCIRLEFFRTLLLDYSHLKDRKSFKATLVRANRLLDSLLKLDAFDQNLFASYLEAYARSLSIFGYTQDARKILSSADSLTPSPFFASQIIRGKIANLYRQNKTGKKIDLAEMSSLLKAASQQKFSPFKRHQKQIGLIAQKIGLAYGKN